MSTHRFDSPGTSLLRPSALGGGGRLDVGSNLPAAAPMRVAPAPKPALLASALKKRWWLLLPILALSAFAAMQAAERFGKESAITRASVIYRGLPGVPGPTVFEPLGPKTCSELLLSHNVLRQVLSERGLEKMPTSVFAELLRVEQTRNSSLINVELTWADPDDAISLLNDLVDKFIEYVASTRRETLRDHIQHVEQALLEAKNNVDLARTHLDQIRRQQQQKLIEGGGESSYVSLMANVSKTRAAIEDERAARAAIEQQIEQLARKRVATVTEIAALKKQTADKLLRETVTRLELLQEDYAENSAKHREAAALVESLGDAAQGEIATVPGWAADLVTRLNESPARLPRAVIEELSEIYEPIVGAHEAAMDDLQNRLRDAERNAETLELKVFPVDSKIALMEQRLEELQAETDQTDGPTAGLDESRLEEASTRLSEAEMHHQLLTQQLGSMRQLEKCQVNEWTATVPASNETTQVSSNRVKIAALALGLCTMGLCAPVVLAEWLGRRDPSDVRFANQTGLPLIAQGALRREHIRQGRFRNLDELRSTDVETVRRAALWIQQSCPRRERGATIVFSAADQQAAAPRLMQLVAQCLAEREERVLLIDALSGGAGDGWAALAKGAAPAEEVNGAPHGVNGHAIVSTTGLAEYLTAECSDLEELIRPTGVRGVDVIRSGGKPLPREAMASSCLSRLLETCRDRYTLILVNGPGLHRLADLQMLASHANGIVLTATRAVDTDPAALAGVAELSELQAPLIGVIS